MAIPSHDEFLSAITLIDASDLGHMRDALKPEAFKGADKRRVRMLIEDVVWANERRMRTLSQEQAVAWLIAQPSIQSLWLWPKVNLSTLMVPRNTEQTADVIEWWFRDLSVLACYDGDEKEPLQAERRRLRRFDRTLGWFLDTGSGSALRWIRHVLTAFWEYFYVDGAVGRIIDDRRQLSSRISMINDGAEAMASLLTDPFFVSLYADLEALRIVRQDQTKQSVRDFSEMATELIAFSKTLAAAHAHVTTDTYPVLRRDQTSRERLLVVRLTAANKGLWFRRRVSATLKLLEIEGVVNRLDARTVERISAASVRRSDFRGEFRRRELKASDEQRMTSMVDGANDVSDN